MHLNTGNSTFRSFAWLVLIIYLIVLTKLILFKRSPSFIRDHFLHHYSWQKAKANMHKANLKPFTTIKLYLNSRGNPEYASNNLWGNTLGFIPLGIFLPLLFTLLRRPVHTITCVFLISLGFETFQLLSMLGIFDVDDLLLNTLGGAIGYLFFWLMHRLRVIE